MLGLSLPPCCHTSLSYITLFDVEITHQRIQTTRSHVSGGHHCHYCVVDFPLLHNATCYTSSLLSCIHVNVVDLLNITCTLVASSMMLRRLECTSTRPTPPRLKEGVGGADLVISCDSHEHVLVLHHQC